MVGAVQSKTPNYGFNRIRYDVVGWHTLEQENWTLVDSLLASIGSVPGNRGAWANSIVYAAGDRVADPDTGTIYRNSVAHTSRATGTFAQDRLAHPTYWSAISILPLYAGNWASGTAYSTQDVVRSGNAYYLCIFAHVATVFNDDLIAMNWALIFDLTDGLAAQAAAANSATLALSYRNDAQSAAAASASSATASAGSATNSSNSATNAQNSANAAASSATAANTAKTGAETARTGAETAQTGAQTARTGAETAQSSAQTARAGAEAARDTAQGYRDQVNPTNFYVKADADAKFLAYSVSQTLSRGNKDQVFANLSAGVRVGRAIHRQVSFLGLTDQIPVDDTIPQNNEGTLALTTNYTPLRVGNMLRVRAIVEANGSGVGIISLIRNNAANAVAAVFANLSATVLLEYEESVAATSSITFDVRGGMAPGSGTLYVNGNSGGRLLGGSAASYLIVEEFFQ